MLGERGVRSTSSHPSPFEGRQHASLRWAGVTPRRRYYGRSDSWAGLPSRPGLPASRARPSRPFRLQSPRVPPSQLSHATPQPDGPPAFVTASAGQGFATGWGLAGSHEAESSSSSCGLAVHLLLLPAPPRGDAVAVGYRPESVCPEGTLTPPTMHARRRTSPRREPWGRGAHPGKPRQGRKRRLTETTDRRSVGVCRPSRGWANGLPESHGLRRGLGVCRPSRGWALRTTSPGLTPWATFCRPCGAG